MVVVLGGCGGKRSGRSGGAGGEAELGSARHLRMMALLLLSERPQRIGA
jgi:hypothetical protein